MDFRAARGQLAAEELLLEKIPFVVIDNVSETVDQAEQAGVQGEHAGLFAIRRLMRQSIYVQIRTGNTNSII